MSWYNPLSWFRKKEEEAVRPTLRGLAPMEAPAGVGFPPKGARSQVEALAAPPSNVHAFRTGSGMTPEGRAAHERRQRERESDTVVLFDSANPASTLYANPLPGVVIPIPASSHDNEGMLPWQNGPSLAKGCEVERSDYGDNRGTYADDSSSYSSSDSSSDSGGCDGGDGD